MTAELDRLRERLIADPAAQAELGGETGHAAFRERALAMAGRYGLALGSDTLDRALDAPRRPLPWPRAPGAGWLPARIVDTPEGPALDWTWLGRRRLSQSFYEEDLRLAGFEPFNRLLAPRTPLDAILTDPAPSAPLRGLIFHLSRCGSTLTTRMLAADPRHIAVSEAAVVDQVVRRPGLEPEARAALLAAVVRALGRVRNPGEARLFLKLDCWHIRFLPLFRQAFPATPWVFLHRDPLEVLVSHQRWPGIQMVPELVAPEVFGLELPHGVPDADYRARVLAAMGEAALAHHAGGGGLIVDYRDLPGAVAERILPHFGVTPDEADRSALRAAAGPDAKAPHQTFTPDAEGKRAAATAELRTLAERHAGEVGRRLHALRA